MQVDEVPEVFSLRSTVLFWSLEFDNLSLLLFLTEKEFIVIVSIWFWQAVDDVPWKEAQS